MNTKVRTNAAILCLLCSILFLLQNLTRMSFNDIGVNHMNIHDDDEGGQPPYPLKIRGFNRAENSYLSSWVESGKNQIFLDDGNNKNTDTRQRQRQQLLEQKIQNFVDGSGIIVNIHITHHAGTTLCHRLGRAVGAPAMYCNSPGKQKKKNNVAKKENESLPFPAYHPWSYEKTLSNVQQVIQNGFQFIGWEHRYPNNQQKKHMNMTDWENPNLISILIIRHPMSRMLADDAIIASDYPNVHKHLEDHKFNTTNENKILIEEGAGIHESNHSDEWDRFTRDEWTDNHALRQFSANHDYNKPVSNDDVNSAKELLSRFTFILDQACLDENLNALGKLLNVTLETSKTSKFSSTAQKQRLPNINRIPLPSIYNRLLNQNSKEIDLYLWSKHLSLIQCLDKEIEDVA